MSFRIVNLDAPECSLSCNDGQLVWRTSGVEKSILWGKVAAIIFTSSLVATPAIPS